MLPNMFSRSTAGTDPRAIDDEEFAQAVNDARCDVIDVREPHEFASGHIPNSINMPVSTFDPRELPSSKPVVLICQSGRRSLHALGQAHAAGRDDVRHYAGGVARWRSVGGGLTV